MTISVSEYHVTDGQFMANVSRNFVPIKFDNVNRGLWNATDCLTNILNCWELVRFVYYLFIILSIIMTKTRNFSYEFIREDHILLL